MAKRWVILACPRALVTDSPLLQLQVKALEKDEWLISVAFLDLAFCVTDMHRVKNFILLSDIHRSITFVAFQQEPYRLVPLGRDLNNAHVTTTNFLLHEDDVTFVTTDIDGVYRLLSYSPSVLTTQGGQRLLTRSEFQSPVEITCSRVLPARSSNEARTVGLARSNEILFGTASGSLEGISAIDEEIGRKLHLLHTSMTRTVQHFAGLNPRSYRCVPHNFLCSCSTTEKTDVTLLHAERLRMRRCHGRWSRACSTARCSRSSISSPASARQR